MTVRSLVTCLALAVSACSLPPELEGEAQPPPVDAADRPIRARVLDASVRTVQLYETGREVSLPILTMGRRETLTLAFDRLTDSPSGVSVRFRHLGLDGPSTLLPTEYLTGFERDDVLDYRPSGATAVPYVHYEYRFPNPRIGFRISGAYEVAATDSRTGEELFTMPFFVTEQSASVQLAFGTTLLDGAIGTGIQPAARVGRGPQLEAYEAFQFTVCFARNGRLDDVRCAPEPRLVDLAQFQFYLPRSEAFSPSQPLFEVDLGGLQTNTEVVDVNLSARPPTALLDLDNPAFGGDVRDAVLASSPLIDGVYRDPGVSGTDAEYVETTFRYVPPDERRVAGSVRLTGTFSGWQPSVELAWDPSVKRYEGTMLLKQGLYVYGYALPRGARRNVFAVGQESLFTAFVYLRDPQLFTDRLVAVESGIAR